MYFKYDSETQYVDCSRCGKNDVNCYMLTGIHLALCEECRSYMDKLPEMKPGQEWYMMKGGFKHSLKIKSKSKYERDNFVIEQDVEFDGRKSGTLIDKFYLLTNRFCLGTDSNYVETEKPEHSYSRLGEVE